MPRNSPKTNSVTSTLSAGPAPGSLLPSIQLQCSHTQKKTRPEVMPFILINRVRCGFLL
jgi:hypothetical protein